MQQSIFNLKCNSEQNLIVSTPSKYKKNDLVTCSFFELTSRVCKLFKDFEDFDWTNVMFAGGLLSAMTEKNYDENKYKQSDIDLFINNEKDFFRVYNYFKSKFDKIYCFGYRHSLVLNIITKEFSRPIQLIGTFNSSRLINNKLETFNDKLELLKSFDLSYCQIGFDGEKYIYTDAFIDTSKTRIAKIMTKKIHAYRFIKAIQRGYSIEKPNHKIFIKNYFDTYTQFNINNNTIQQTDKLRTVDNIDINELLGNHYVKQNLNKSYIPKSHELDDRIYENIKLYYPNPIFINENNIKNMFTF